MDENKRIEEIKKMRDAMGVIGRVVGQGDKMLAAEIKNHLAEVQEELKQLTWGRCKNQNCSIEEWIRSDSVYFINSKINIYLDLRKKMCWITWRNRKCSLTKTMPT